MVGVVRISYLETGVSEALINYGDIVMPESAEVEKLDKKWVEGQVRKWEGRHDEWARKGQYGKFENFSGLKKFLSDKLLSDWRFGLAFFIDRTTYQGFGDKNAEKVSTYMTKKILNLPEVFSGKNQNEVIGEIGDMIRILYEAKNKGKFPTIRWKQDIARLACVSGFLIFCSDEKNLTKIVQNENYDYEFIKRFPFVGDKVANFYFKFLSLILEVPNELPIVVVDTHVRQSLVRYHLIFDQERLEKIKEVIISEADRINVLPIQLETALYEENFEFVNTSGQS
jgi:hypothetical protein